jgi:uncharacterized protein
MELSNALDAAPSQERERIDHASGRLVGSRCPECRAVSWPGRAVCHRCGAAGLQRVELASAGVLLSHTRCWVPRPGLEPPFVLGQVRFPEGVTVFGHIRGLPDSAPSGTEVRVVVAEEDSLPAFWFDAGQDDADA